MHVYYVCPQQQALHTGLAGRVGLATHRVVLDVGLSLEGEYAIRFFIV